MAVKLQPFDMKIIHVNRQLIALNARLKKPIFPVYTIKQGRKTRYAYGVTIFGECEMVDVRQAKQLPWGARAWIEAPFRVELKGEMTWAEVVELRKKHAVD